MVDGPARLEDYALIGDCQSAALVSREGSIDWWCVPRFDSGACFAALLGTPDHGRFLIAPVAPSQSMHRYLAGTMVLETEHDTPSGRVRVIDCLVMGRDRPLLVRTVKGLSGEVNMRVELVVRFDYGSIVPWVRTVDGVWSAIAGPDGLGAADDGRSARRRYEDRRRVHGGAARAGLVRARLVPLARSRARFRTTRRRSSRARRGTGATGRRAACTRASGTSRCCARS